MYNTSYWLMVGVLGLQPFDSTLVRGRYPLPTTTPKVLGCVIADYSSQGNVERTMNPARADFLSTQVNGVFCDHAAGAMLNAMNRWARRAEGLVEDASSRLLGKSILTRICGPNVTSTFRALHPVPLS